MLLNKLCIKEGWLWDLLRGKKNTKAGFGSAVLLWVLIFELPKSYLLQNFRKERLLERG